MSIFVSQIGLVIMVFKVVSGFSAFSHFVPFSLPKMLPVLLITDLLSISGVLKFRTQNRSGQPSDEVPPPPNKKKKKKT